MALFSPVSSPAFSGGTIILRAPSVSYKRSLFYSNPFNTFADVSNFFWSSKNWAAGRQRRRSFSISARNRILFEQHEITDDGRIQLTAGDSRAQHMRTVLKSGLGDSVRIGVINGRSGAAIVEAVEEDAWSNSHLEHLAFQLHCGEWDEAPPARGLSLILAMPRPKNMKRLWSILGQLGLSSIMVTNAARVEKVYFSSKAVEAPTVRSELLLGLEQAGETLLPQVSFHLQLVPLLKALCRGQIEQTTGKEPNRVEPMKPGTILLMAHPGASKTLQDILSTVVNLQQGSTFETVDEAVGENRSPVSKSTKSLDEDFAAPGKDVVLAVGPEGGWTEHELSLLAEFGFQHFSIGSKPLRTDVRMRTGYVPRRCYASFPIFAPSMFGSLRP
eukprot:jgi/Mesen1/6711/ME000344S05993